MEAMWLAIAISGAILIRVSHLPLRKRAAKRRRWAWWQEFNQRMRRYPTSQEVDDWIFDQSGSATPSSKTSLP